MATWTDVISTTDGGTPVKYQVESSAPDAGTGAGNRHRIVENGVAYDPAPQGRPCRSPNYMAGTFDPGDVLHWAGADRGDPKLLRVTDITP